MGAAASSSSSSASLPPKKYDVFISFRGEDTRSNFTSHLYNALCQNSVTTFIDNYELHKGDEISQSLIEAIQNSSISLVVFSENYASSKWCLDELIQILQCRKCHGQVVIPVFYKVDPSDVRKQNGTYKEAFTKHEGDFIHNQDKVNGWRDALFKTANLAGWDSGSYMNESEFIQKIVDDVWQNLDLQSQYPSALGGLVGIEENCKNIELLLEEAPIIGIWGMGGIGKTTMARVVFDKLSSQYESCCFLENFREQQEKHGLTYIHDKLLFELLNGKNLDSRFVTRRLSRQKVLIVLDDVSSSMQLEYLAKKCNFLEPNSRVIITTRDKHLLIGRVNEIYEAKALNYQESLTLFSFKAFHKDHLKIGYEQLSNRAIDHAQGIPLALTVLGSFLHPKTLEEWDSALEKLKKTPHKDIQGVLKLSYDGLDDEEKIFFLDIACFLNGEDKEHVITLLDSYGFHAIIGLRTLVDRALITIDRRVWMHDLIQQMGREIVNQECFEEPGKRSRLWDPEEVLDVLENNQGTDAIEGIMLDISKIREINLSADTFRKMTRLRFLNFYSSGYEGSCNMNLPSGLESFPNRLRCLHWYGYPLESLPSTFCPQKFVELCMKCSHLKKLWDGVQDFVNLKRIDLYGSKQLMELPNLSKAQKLEMIDISFCRNLPNIHPSILSLHSLVTLKLLCCESLKILKSENHLKSLKALYVDGCCNLKEFSLSSEEIMVLHLRTTGIEILHSSIGRLKKLERLELNCSKVKSLPIKELSSLTSLKELRLYDCGQVIDEPSLHILFEGLCSLQHLVLENSSNLSMLPGNISSLSSLCALGLAGSNIEYLPASIKYLSKLKTIDLSNCRRLQSVPELPPKLKTINLSNCRRLQSVPELPPKLKTIDLSNCRRLQSVPELPPNLETIDLSNCRRLQSVPELPPLITSLEAKNCVSLQTVFPSKFSAWQHKVYGNYNFSFQDCVNLNEHSFSVEFVQPLMEVPYHNCFRVYIRYPGSRVPECFGYKQATEASITIELPKSSICLRGFIFCCVISPFTPPANGKVALACEVTLDNPKYDPLYGSSFTKVGQSDSDHVVLWYDWAIQSTIDNEKEVTFQFGLKIKFDFNSPPRWHDFNGFIKACGVYPICHSECDNWSNKCSWSLERMLVGFSPVVSLLTEDLEESSEDLEESSEDEYLLSI